MKNLLKYMAIAAICAAAFTFSACDDSSTGASDTEITSSDSGNNGGDNGNDENGGKSSAIAPASSESKAASSSSATKAPDASTDILKINGGADEVGIYAIVIRMNMDLAGEKGEIEMLYYSSETGIETQVNDFVLQYERDANGTYEVHTFSDGEVYLNLHKQSEIKFTNEFGATTRADRVEIYYTPDGGKKELVRTATADEFRGK